MRKRTTWQRALSLPTIAAGLYKRAIQRIQKEAKREEETFEAVVEQAAVNNPSPVSVPSHTEAPASVNTYIVMGGHRVQVTLRGNEIAPLLAQMADIVAQYPVVEETKPEQKPAGWCAVHSVQMKERTGKSGNVFHSHQVDGKWCYGK